MPARPLFVTRRFPPSVGGMQTLAAGVWRTLSAAVPHSVLLAHGGSNRALPWWLPSAVLRTARLVSSRRVDMVLTGDALMYAAVSPVLRLLRTPCSTMVLGLDMTYDNHAYRAVVYPALRRAENVIAISEATATVARDLGVPPERVHVVPLGVDSPEVTPEQRVEARGSLHELLGTGDERLLLLTLGRLVRRKGVVWFLRNVLPQLPSHVVYVVAGDGDDAERVRDTVAAMGLRERVQLLGEVDERERELLLQGADLFVQPNIRVPGDIEGFGLVTIEAAMRGLPVLAADLEGISEAVVDGVTGRLLPSGDAQAWVAELTTLAADRAHLVAQGLAFQEAARSRYSERRMGEELVRLLGLGPDPVRVRT
jgi:phosphatidylinositol alpha-1,6-mannosyltransferase